MKPASLGRLAGCLLAALGPCLAAASPGLPSAPADILPAFGEEGAAKVSLGTRRQASRLLLEFRARELGLRIDSLWVDSVRVPMERLPRYKRALQAARKVLSDMETGIAEMRTKGLETRQWDKLWTRTERTLFGLDRFIAQTERLQLPVKRPAPEDPAGGGGRPGTRPRDEL